MRRIFLLHITLLIWVLPLQAQQAIPSITLADFTFDTGLQHYEQKNYDAAYDRFMQVVREFSLNTKTTAALLMAGKALYAEGRFTEAVAVLDELGQTYPQSRYIGEAIAVRNKALEKQEIPTSNQRPIFKLGIVLPQGNLTLAQPLFNGIRLAVDAHNAARPDLPVQMMFRSSGANPDPRRAQTATRELINREGVSALIGPFFSEDAEAVVNLAEQSETVLLAPVALSPLAQRERGYVFQVNPPLEMRAQLMARFAVQRMRQPLLAVAMQDNPESRLMGDAFREEVERLGSEVAVFKILSTTQQWYDIAEEIKIGETGYPSAVYIPLIDDAFAFVNAALVGLGSLGESVRILGNEFWNNYPNRQAVSRFRTIFTDRYWADPQATLLRDFLAQYQKLTGGSATGEDLSLALAGYDTVRFLLDQIQWLGEGVTLRERLQQIPYEGTGLRMDFRNSNINEGVFFLQYTPTAVTRVQGG